jgi:hypothetical protein
MLVYFDPTCEHCRLFTANLVKRMNDFTNTEIVMISYLPIAEIKQFESDFNLGKFHNIKVGTEGHSFVVQRWYNVQRFPFTALFNESGTCITSYREAPSMDELLLEMKNS